MTGMCIAAANYLIERTNEYNNGKSYNCQILMSCKRLQKLLYFSDIIYMKAHNGESMFKDDFYAWPSGPVIPSVYDEFMKYQDGTMLPLEGYHTPNTECMNQALQYVFEQTEDISTETLVELSHKPGGPWSKVYNPNDAMHLQIIPKDYMYDFYQNNNNIFEKVI